MIANLLEGMEHQEAARLAGLSRSAAYDWHNRYEEGGIEGLRDRPRRGRQPRVDAVTSARFKERVVAGAALERDGVVAFRAVDAQRILKEEFEIDCSLSSTLPATASDKVELVGTAAVREGRIRRLIINLPPRHLKSLLASIAFPAWCLGHDPSAQILCVSYAQDLADKLARDCRSIMTSPWYRQIFPTRLAPHRQAVQEFITTRQGYRLAIAARLLSRVTDHRLERRAQ
jgi:transposase